ncbi:gliding motility lipoprotein GldB [Algoriphagus namhaensis]|uniref:Gliding motility lipoprotein GldB n=1 Tax=Algoriphagus namhaensis TaxID=915353 RepID=A0ABV8ASH4_9BACT
MKPFRSTFSKILPFSLLLIFSCGPEEQKCELDEEILSSDLEVQITRLEDDFFTANTPEDFFFLMEKHPEFTSIYLQPELYLNQDSLVSSLIQVHQDSAMLELYKAVKTEIPDLSQVEKDLENAFKYIQFYFPYFIPPKVYSFVSGFNSDLVITPELIVIGLDYFLPITHPFQPDLPRYMADRYDIPYLVPMIVTAMSSQFNEVDLSDQSLLAEMVYYGKAYHFTKSILPCTSEGLIIGYTEDEVGEIYANEEYIWAHFVENELLYETNPFEIQKYLGEAPSTDAISTKAPGRIGRWLGWNIVDDYQISNDVNLADLMAEKDTEKIFRQSGYRPRGLE